MENIFNQQELPMEEFNTLGLIKNGSLNLTETDLQALLCGRRTDFITLEKFSSYGINIEKIDLKLSLQRNTAGKLSLLLHPIHKVPRNHFLLADFENSLLETGEWNNITKTYNTQDSKWKTWLIEYDAQTREFIASNPDLIQVPMAINNFTLTHDQIRKFRYGEMFELPDGTIIQRRAACPQGLTSNRNSLVLAYQQKDYTLHLLKDQLENIYNSNFKELDWDTKNFREALLLLQQQKEKPLDLPKETEITYRHEEPISYPLEETRESTTRNI